MRAGTKIPLAELDIFEEWDFDYWSLTDAAIEQITISMKTARPTGFATPKTQKCPSVRFSKIEYSDLRWSRQSIEAANRKLAR